MDPEQLLLCICPRAQGRKPAGQPKVTGAGCSCCRRRRQRRLLLVSDVRGRGTKVVATCTRTRTACAHLTQLRIHTCHLCPLQEVQSRSSGRKRLRKPCSMQSHWREEKGRKECQRRIRPGARGGGGTHCCWPRVGVLAVTEALASWEEPAWATQSVQAWFCPEHLL